MSVSDRAAHAARERKAEEARLRQRIDLPKKERKPLRAQPRSKGNRAEREIIDLFHSYGWRGARRNFQSGGQGGGDILNGPTDVHVEVKHRERCSIWDWLAQAEAEARPTDTPAVLFRRNRSGWYATIPLSDLLDLLKEREESRNGREAVHGGTEEGE